MLAGALARPDAAAPLLAALRAQRLAPLAFDIARRAGEPARGRLAPLEADYYAAARRYLALAAALDDVLAACAAAAPGVVVLKGMALAEPVYGNPALRPMNDIDVLVPHRAASRVREALEIRGWQAAATFAHDLRARAASIFLRPAREGAPRACVDVHWSLVDDKSGPAAARWSEAAFARAGEAAIGSRRARVLAPEDALIHACAHLALNHGLLGLLRYCDLALMLRAWGPTLDWERLAAQVADARLRGAVSLALATAAALVGAPVPPSMLERLAPRALRARALARWLPAELAAVRGVRGQDYVVPLLLVDRGRDLAALLARRALGLARRPRAA